MVCPECGHAMDKGNCFDGQWWGNVITLEIVFWLLFLLVFITGVVGFIAVTVGIILIMLFNCHKIRYSCPYCSHSETFSK
jgi:hypothetical protein